MGLSSSQSSGVGAGLQSASSMIGGIISAIMARKQRQHEVAMYDKQKQDSIDFWKMENEYNSPAMQMQRLRDAKLNPNLIYGSPQPMGMAGNIDRPNMSVSDSYTQAGSGIQQAIQPISGVMDHIYNLRLINAQTNNVNQNTQTQKSTEALNYATKALRILEQGFTHAKTSTERETLQGKIRLMREQIANTAQDTILKSSSTNVNRQQVDNMQAQKQVILDENLRKWQLQQSTLANAWKDYSLKVKTLEKIDNEINLGWADYGIRRELATNTQFDSEVEREMKALDYFLKANQINPNSTGVNKIIDKFILSIDAVKGRFDGGKSIKDHFEELRSQLLKIK